MAESRTSARKLTAAERRAQAVALRVSGATYQQIAAKLGVTDSAAHKLVAEALATARRVTAATADELRDLETLKLDAMELSIATQVNAGHLGAIDRKLKIMERRARLWGLDAPTKASNLNWNMADFSDDELAQIAEGADPATIVKGRKL